MPLGSSACAGLAGFVGFARQVGAERALRERVRLPVQERRTGSTHASHHQLALPFAHLSPWDAHF
jgi:hypothetical protein